MLGLRGSADLGWAWWGSLPGLWSSTGQQGGFAGAGGPSHRVGPQQGQPSCLVSAPPGLSFCGGLAQTCPQGAPFQWALGEPVGVHEAS